MIGLLEALMPLFVGAPLMLGAVLFVISNRHPLQPIIGLGTLLALLAGSWVLLAVTFDGTVLSHQIGLWPGGIAIAFVADSFSSLILTAGAVVAVISFLYMMASGESQSPSIPALVLVLMGGVSGALLTADLFNLFVFIEVMLLPSYGLLIFLKSPRSAGC